jgi:Putative zinc-finger
MTETDTQIIHRFAEQNMLVERYLLGELSGMDLEDFERHLFECPICFEQVKIGQVFTESLASAYLRKGPRALIAALLQRIKEFWTKHVLNEKDVAHMLGLFIFQLGPVPIPPPPEYSAVPWISVATSLMGALTILLLLASLLFRFSGRSMQWREFWARHVCAFMEEHAVRTDETKGGM